VLNTEQLEQVVELEPFNAIADVPIPILAELDHRTISFRELLNLDVNSLLTLFRPAGENIDLYAGDVLLGNAEILVVDGSLAVRVADLRDETSIAFSTSHPQKEEPNLGAG
jgi:flagellar motor switch/type III secretory pathway protein FliN